MKEDYSRVRTLMPERKNLHCLQKEGKNTRRSRKPLRISRQIGGWVAPQRRAWVGLRSHVPFKLRAQSHTAGMVSNLRCTHKKNLT